MAQLVGALAQHNDPGIFHKCGSLSSSLASSLAVSGTQCLPAAEDGHGFPPGTASGFLSP